jgi:hypothetical protein
MKNCAVEASGARMMQEKKITVVIIIICITSA